MRELVRLAVGSQTGPPAWPERNPQFADPALRSAKSPHQNDLRMLPEARADAGAANRKGQKCKVAGKPCTLS
jgi:hypothetical protein